MSVEELLEQAEHLLRQDIEQEIREMRAEFNASAEILAKYEKTRDLFKKVLSLAPDNARAREGLDICEEMLTPYAPVQYMVPAEPLRIDVNSNEVSAPPLIAESPLPWVLRRQQRSRDRAGLSYTGEQFSKAVKDALEHVRGLVEEARAAAAQQGATRDDIFQQYLAKLEQFQDDIHREWKGHGPDILGEASSLLRDALKR